LEKKNFLSSKELDKRRLKKFRHMQSGDHRGTPGLSKDSDHRKFFKNTQTLHQTSPNYLKIVENISSKQLFSINKSMF
jgi:hypothetical protein